jgi:hypothetical protein
MTMKKHAFVTARVYPGDQNALVKNMMKQMGINDPNEAVRRINSGEWIVSEAEVIRDWREENGVIYFDKPFLLLGMTGQEWFERLEEAGKKISKHAESVLRSPYFKPARPGIEKKVVVLKGELFSDDDRTTENIRTQAHAGTFTSGQHLFGLSPEIGCMIRERYAQKEIKAMGLRCIVDMHPPIEDFEGNPCWLSVGQYDNVPYLSTCLETPRAWSRDVGFAFTVA